MQCKEVMCCVWPSTVGVTVCFPGERVQCGSIQDLLLWYCAESCSDLIKLLVRISQPLTVIEDYGIVYLEALCIF